MEPNESDSSLPEVYIKLSCNPNNISLLIKDGCIDDVEGLGYVVGLDMTPEMAKEVAAGIMYWAVRSERGEIDL